jgi:hypothetical protein
VNGVDEPAQPRRRIVVRRVQRIRRGEDAAVVVARDHASPRGRRRVIARGLAGDLPGQSGRDGAEPVEDGWVLG